MTVLLPFCLVFISPVLVAILGMYWPKSAGPLSISLTAAAFFAALWGALLGGGTVSIPWAAAWNLNFTLTLDGLAAEYTLLATGIGFFVLLYSASYMPRHIQTEHETEQDLVRFYALMLLFMAAMVGVVMSLNLLLLFIFWDLTTITSYLLIGFDTHKPAARSSALMALLVTGITSIFLLVGALIFFGVYGTFSIPELIQRVQPGPTLNLAVGLMIVAALAKSAQFPFHFWLPTAMIAPTPVSAFLHSAAMVAAGVFLLERIYPLLSLSPLLLNIILGFGFFSLFMGSVLAITSGRMKELLAYSTTSHYGYAITLLGFGGPLGAAGASYYVFAHALAKSTLFMSAGAIMELTGEERALDKVGGYGKRLPILAAATAVAAAALSGLPLTVGFFKDDLFFKAALGSGPWFTLLAVSGAILTLVYSWRFWRSIFLGQEKIKLELPAPIFLVAPQALLAIFMLFSGVVTLPFQQLANAAGQVVFHAATSIDLTYHLDLRLGNQMALIVYLLATLLILTRPAWVAVANWISSLGMVFGPEKMYQSWLHLMNIYSEKAYGIEMHNLATRIQGILAPTFLLIALSLVPYPYPVIFRISPIHLTQVLPAVVLIAAALSTVFLTVARSHLMLVLIYTVVSYGLAAAYAFLGAPDLTLVAVLIGTVSTYFLLAALAIFPRKLLHAQNRLRRTKLKEWVKIGTAVLAGLTAFVVCWAILSYTSPQESIAVPQVLLAPSAHANNVVTALLSDFRGLDTVGEVTVITISMLGISTLVVKHRSRGDNQ